MWDSRCAALRVTSNGFLGFERLLQIGQVLGPS
jgi:hypothetical protein